MFVSSYNVFAASSIKEAYKLLNEYDIHLVVIKKMMPEMSGIQFCESTSHDFPDLINIILGNSDGTHSLDRAYKKNHVFRFVQRPYSEIDIKMSIDNALELYQEKFKNKQLVDKLSNFQIEQEHVLDLFKRYVPEEVVVRALQTSQDDMMKPGESRVVSVLFVDIRSFTKFSSHLAPTEVVNFLNDYWDVISQSVKRNNGSVNKYIGDGMLAIFGAPISHINNHENAVYAALDMIDSLDDINQRYAEKLGTEISVGIGINSGEVIVGNVGTDNFMEYTVIGNTVNVASRMESISKRKPNSIIISENTYDLVKHAFETTNLSKAELSDKNETIYYCEVTGRKSDNIYPMNSKSNI